jgi:DNA replication protein DnaC
MNPITVQDIIEAGKHAALTGSVLTEWAEKGTPKQREYLHGVLLAEHESRLESRRQRLLKSARLPAMKTLTGFDYTSVRFPADYGREPLESLEFINRAQDLVLYGDVGTGKTHMATALVAAACRQGIQARFFTTSALVMMLRRARTRTGWTRSSRPWPKTSSWPSTNWDTFRSIPKGPGCCSRSSRTGMKNAV